MSSAGQQLVAGRIPGERIATTVATSDSATFTTTATTVLTVVAPLVTGRRYAVWTYVRFDSSVDNDDVQASIKEDSSSGTTIATIVGELVADNQAGAGMPFYIYGEFDAVATGDKTFVVTGQRNAGTGNVKMESAVGRASYLAVEYISG
jgi:hypothetical protein